MLLLRVLEDRLQEHDQKAGDREDDLGQNADVVDARRDEIIGH